MVRRRPLPHIHIAAKASEELGARPGNLPWYTHYWRLTHNQEDPAQRLAVNNCWAEARLCHTLHEWMKLATEGGDHKLAELLDYLLADEVVHVDIGTKWVRHLTKDDPERLERIHTWSEDVAREILVFQAQAFGGSVEAARQERIQLSFA